MWTLIRELGLQMILVFILVCTWHVLPFWESNTEHSIQHIYCLLPPQVCMNLTFMVGKDHAPLGVSQSFSWLSIRARSWVIWATLSALPYWEPWHYGGLNPFPHPVHTLVFGEVLPHQWSLVLLFPNMSWELRPWIKLNLKSWNIRIAGGERVWGVGERTAWM